jgi:hypothetical protein
MASSSDASNAALRNSSAYLEMRPKVLLKGKGSVGIDEVDTVPYL